MQPSNVLNFVHEAKRENKLKLKPESKQTP